MAFSFGAPVPAADGSAPARNAFSIPIAVAQPAVSTPTEAPAKGGFSFDNSSITPSLSAGTFSLIASAAPASEASAASLDGSSFVRLQNNTSIPASGSSFNFGGNSTPAPSSLSKPTLFGGSSTSINLHISAEVPHFEDCFPFLKIKSIISEVLTSTSEDSTTSRLQGEELKYRLQCTAEDGIFGLLLANPQPLKFASADPSLRQKLQQNPQIKLHGQTAMLTQSIMEEVYKLSSQLRIPELNAMSLYAEASNPVSRRALEVSLDTSFVENALGDKPHIGPLLLGNNVLKAARELYFWERSALMKTLLLLIQYRLKASPKSAILLATDPLLKNNLIANLVTFIRESTKTIVDLQIELNSSQLTTSFQYAPIPPKKKTAFAKVLLEFVVQERQRASECLFYLAYHSQCTPIEVASLIDIVKDLTNGLCERDDGLRILDPSTDVPDTYINQETPQQIYGPSFTSALPPLIEKDPIEWSKELVDKVWKSGKPQLQQCVSVLIVTAICSLDCRNALWNRDTHCQNEVGNDLHRHVNASGSSDTSNLILIHERLDARNVACNQWKRQDIWGLLAGSYGLLLVPLHSLIASPRISGRRSTSVDIPPHSIDVRRTGRACLKAVFEQRAHTFARLTLIPSFQRHRDGPDALCDLYQFLMSVTSECVSHYVDVLSAFTEIPSSRVVWEENENEDLKVRRDQQEQQRQFNVQYGATNESLEVIPQKVDLLQRPDCLDDIVALACVICSAGSHFALCFWSSEDDRYIPSRFLLKLQSMKSVDGSLIPAYLSFLSALTTATSLNSSMNSATVVYRLLSEQPATDVKFPASWSSILNNIRWYARRLDPRFQVASMMPSNLSQNVSDRSATSTAYYYGTENVSFSTRRDYNSELPDVNVAKATDTTKSLELGDDNTAILMSHLMVISRVAAGSPSARAALLSMSLPVDDAGAGSFEEDPMLLVLFSCAMVGITPNVRGAIFATIASLLRLEGANAEECKVIKDMASKAWELLELSNIVPVSVLSQYQTAGGFGSFQGMAFPPSLSAPASSKRQSVLPPDPKFGILYEMEYLESQIGCYPSTEGLLLLIDALVSTAGCPQDLGKQIQGNDVGGRAQLGCSPYIEYVIHFVLPRVIGSDTSAAILPFCTYGDQDRLVALALEIIQRLITHYAVPLIRPESPIPRLLNDNNIQDNVSAASQLFRLPSFAKSLVIGVEETDMLSFRLDFRKNHLDQQGLLDVDSNVVSSPFPRAKSPGFMILSEILSLYSGELFTSLILAICKDGADLGVRALCGFDGYRRMLSRSLFREFYPSITIAKSNTSESRTLSLQPLFTNQDANSSRDSFKNDPVAWRELSIMRSLLILCAAAAREGAFIAATSGTTSYVPVLKFKSTFSSISTTCSQLSTLRSLFLVSHTCGATKFLETLTRLIGYTSSASENVMISTSALALAIYTCNQMSPHESVIALGGEHLFASSVSNKLRASISSRVNSTEHTEIVDLIFSLLCQKGISDLLLGFNKPQKPLSKLASFLDSNNCFDTVLYLIREEAFLTNPATSAFAAKCYEIVYRQISRHVSVSAIVVSKLKAAKFWRSNLLRFLADRGSGQQSLLNNLSKESSNILHSAAWFLKALAHLVSLNHEPEIHDLFSSSDKFLHRAVACIPLTQLCLSFGNSSFLLSIRNYVEASMAQINGPEDITLGFYVVSKLKLEEMLKQDNAGIANEGIEDIMTWADDWNRNVEWDCAASHISHATTVLVDCYYKSAYESFSTPDVLEDLVERQMRLLDLILNKLQGVSEISTPPLETACRHLSTATLLIVEKLVLSKQTAFEHAMGYFFVKLVRVVLGASMRENQKAKESSAVLGSSLAILLSLDFQFELSSDQITDVAKVMSYFASLVNHSVKGFDTANGIETQSALSLLSRTILSSLLNYQGMQEYQIAIRSLTENTLLSHLVQTIQMLDYDAPTLLTQIARTEEGARNLINCGTMQALEAACHIYRRKEEETLMELRIGATSDSNMVGVPNFLSRHFELIATLLASKSFKPNQQYDVVTSALKIFSQYKWLLCRATLVFPRFGDVWTMLVKGLSLCASILNKERNEISRYLHSDVSLNLLMELQIIVAPIALDILQYPFPPRFLAPLPLKLRQAKEGLNDRGHLSNKGTWWQRVEDRESSELPGVVTLPSPLSISAFGGDLEEKGEPWSNIKYEVCMDGMRLLDVSLSLLANRHGTATMRFEYTALARGLCCLVSSGHIIEGRMKSFDHVSASILDFDINLMEVDDDKNSRNLMLMEKKYLSALFPLFMRCIEKLLLLINCNLQNAKGFESPKEWRNLGTTISLALRSLNLENMKVGNPAFVTKLTASLDTMANEAIV